MLRGRGAGVVSFVPGGASEPQTAGHSMTVERGARHGGESEGPQQPCASLSRLLVLGLPWGGGG